MVKSIGEENIPQFKTQLDLLEKLLNREATVENDAFNLIYSSTEKSILVYKWIRALLKKLFIRIKHL